MNYSKDTISNLNKQISWTAFDLIICYKMLGAVLLKPLINYNWRGDYVIVWLF